jgi:hypothetical protein
VLVDKRLFLGLFGRYLALSPGLPDSGFFGLESQVVDHQKVLQIDVLHKTLVELRNLLFGVLASQDAHFVNVLDQLLSLLLF